MNFGALAIGLLAAVVAFGVITLIDRWWVALRARRTSIGALREIRLDGPGGRAKLLPESRYVVELSDSGVSCSRPDGSVERVDWADLQSVEIVNTGRGAFDIDFYWILHGTARGCVVPGGATGEPQLLERLQKLPDFDNGAVIAAMTTTASGRTSCWRRRAASA